MRALLVGGQKVPVEADIEDGREKGLWWEPNGKGARKRRGKASLIVLHHTGGENAADGVYANLRDRTSPKAPHGLSVHFVIDQRGRITQLADLETVTLHAGHYNGRSVGIEVASKGIAPCHRKWARDSCHEVVHNKGKEYLRFYPPQTEAVDALCRALCLTLGIPMVLPMAMDGRVLRDRPSLLTRLRWKGIVGHYHLSSQKSDPCPELLDDLAKRYAAIAAMSGI